MKAEAEITGVTRHFSRENDQQKTPKYNHINAMIFPNLYSPVWTERGIHLHKKHTNKAKKEKKFRRGCYTTLEGIFTMKQRL